MIKEGCENESALLTEHVSEAERCGAQLNIPVAHGQSKHSANVPLTLTSKPNPAQITLWH